MQFKKKENRAAIFAPFDSLKGLFDLMKEKERIVVSKKDLSEDDLALLDYTMQTIKTGMIVKVIYYDGNDYISKEGMVASIDREYGKYIRIVNTRIDFQDIYSIEITNKNHNEDIKNATL